MSGKIYIMVIAAITSILFRMEGIHYLSVSFMFVLIYLLWRNRERIKLVFTSILILFYFLLNPYYFQPPLQEPPNNTLTGSIRSIPKFDGDKVSFEVKTNKPFGDVLLNYYARSEKELYELKNLKVGVTCNFQGEFVKPQAATNFYAFDYKQYLEQRGIYYIFQPEQINMRKCYSTNKNIFEWLQSYRQIGIEYVQNHFPEQSRGIVNALIFGDRHEMEGELVHSYQSLGIIHLLAVSGLHIGLISGLLYYLLLRIGLTREKTIHLLLFLLPIYAVIAGGAPSVLRATLMAIFVLLCLKFRHKANPLDGISASCLLLLSIQPAYVYYLGFQLSFIVSYTLIASAHFISKRFYHSFSRLVAVTTVAQLVSLPIILYHFYELSILSLPLNFIYIPFISLIILPLSYITLFLKITIPLLGNPICYLFNEVVSFAHKCLLSLANIQITTFTFGQPPLWLVLLYFIVIAYVFISFERDSTLKNLYPTIFLLAFVFCLHWNLPYITGIGEVTFLDVGQGDSIFIELPYRKAVYLIDTGGQVNYYEKEQWQKRKSSYDVGQQTVIPFLKAKGIRKINKLMLTHGHFDHIGGSQALFKKIKVEQILYPYGNKLEDFEENVLKQFEDTGTNILFVKQGDRWSVDRNQFYILNPLGDESDKNNQSIVLYAHIGGLDWLFTGDIEKAGEERLLNAFPALKVDVLKVAHHGSHTSTTDDFLTMINPKYAVISVGKNNRFHHPHKEVLQRLHDRQIHVWRTDMDGAIRYTFFRRGGGVFKTKINEKRTARVLSP